MSFGELKFPAVDIDEVAVNLASAFLARVERFAPEDRERFLRTCRRSLEVLNPEVSAIFFAPARPIPE